jgi:hypothetical protein
LAKECYSMKLDLLTNATVVDDAIRFVSSEHQKKSREKEMIIDVDSNDDKQNKIVQEVKEDVELLTENQVF